ncbi:hypothetical protein ACFYYL_40295 [Actinomadura geliboluensis]|uniref:hypothetical protein n=1 Tax=Actinomadura geliboluensis TaxID=882440 RepID=UPI0036AADBDF
MAVTMALTGWTMAPWIDVDGTPHVLWQLAAVEVIDGPAMLLPALLMVTLFLGVATSAAATRGMACAAWLVGLVATISTLAFSLDPGEKYDIEYGANYAVTLSAAYVVVFFRVWRSAKQGPSPEKVAEWMAPSFGTVDRHYRRR